MAQYNETENINKNIILKARSGDDDALKFIFESFKGYIRYLSNKFYLAGADSDDLVQEGMIGLFKAINEFSVEKDGFNFFAAVCIENQIKTAVRTANRRKHQPLNSSVSLSDSEDNKLVELFGEDSANPEKIFIKNETYAQVTKLIYNSLTKMELQILLLYNKGLSYKEISELSGKSAKSIDNAIQRIKKKAEKIRMGVEQ